MVDLNGYDIIGIGFPSYGFNPPKIVVDSCNNINSVDHKKVFLFLTCAGPCYLNEAAFFGIKRILNRKGYRINYEKTFCMPANILIRYNDDIVKRIYDAAIKKTKIMATDILNNITNVRNDRFVPHLFRWLLFLIEWPSIKTVPLDFAVGKECNKCMKCVRLCPRKNIRLIKEKVKHGLKCEACYRCVYNCPQKAIKGRLYNAAIFKEGYNIKEKVNKCKAIQITKPLRGIYRTMESYFND
jgi:ferredoxin